MCVKYQVYECKYIQIEQKNIIKWGSLTDRQIIPIQLWFVENTLKS